MTAPDRTPPIDSENTTVMPRVVSAGLPAEELEASAEPSFEEEHKGAAGNSAMMAVGSLVSRGTGFLRTAVMAAALGGGLVGNAYTTAQIFPGMIYELLLGGILSSVLVPMLVRARKSDPDRGQAYTQRLLTLAVIVLGITTVLAVICAPLLTIAYASDEATDAQKHLITTLSYLMLPTIFFYGLTGLCSAVLNTRGQFAAPMWTPILNNAVVIATGVTYLVIFGDAQIDPEQMTPARILVLGGGVLLGIVVQALGLLPALRKVGFRWRARFDFRELGLRRLATVGGWMFCYVIVNQLALLVLTNLLNRAGHVGGAGPMIYNNVFLLMMMAHGIVAVSIITALLPRMSAAASEGRAGDIAADLSKGIRTVVVMLAPVAVTYVVLALPISIALFERGAFHRADSIQTAPVLAMAGLALLPFAISQLFNFSYYSLQDTKTPALINLPVITMRLAIQLGWWAAFAAATTAVGMMLGNAVSYVFAALLSAALLKRRIGLIGLRRISVTVAKVVVAGLIAAAAGYGTVQLLFMGATQSEVSGFTSWVTLATGGIVICGVYGAAALALKIGEVQDVLGMVRRKLGR
ncbi:murein biosynthesis integral membrane protein MurJ [Catellatospora bangladeshensis]|uniref:Lipid II flippase MurJ n=2 Tax=Catellatospora bangladeshensis TaxID=310355 RepID=A0A8J3JGN1_9ACTN|nr:murein biosynthesis integral membrane protein MurJ [Catellatospora bangladeshensis]GIF84542.1 lipid II flippase MurJ [Catellatospora bangladeshensis]